MEKIVRKDLLVIGQVYHVFTKSIAGFKIFNDNSELSRMKETIRYYQRAKPKVKFSMFINTFKVGQRSSYIVTPLSDEEKNVEIIAYCIMPTHLHLVLKQLKENGISTLMSNALNSYTRYFNTKHNRKGPLWEGRFKSALVKTDERLLHLTRYVHLNPVTAYLVDRPEEWVVSSYNEYLSNGNTGICKYDKILNIEPGFYKSFVEDRASYQRELAKIKDLLIE